MINFNRTFNTPANATPAHIANAQRALLAHDDDAWVEAMEAWDMIEAKEAAPWEWEEDKSPEEWEGW